MRRIFSRDGAYPDLFGSESSFAPGVGDHFEPGEPLRGYYIDFSLKAEVPEWPPPFLGPLADQLHVQTAQWGLGAYERFVAGEGDEWLEAAAAAAEHMVEIQEREGRLRGGWIHGHPMPHTFELEPPWLSAMAQGEGASLLARVHSQTGDPALADAARLALEPMSVPVAEGGVLALIDGRRMVEEYPTATPSAVLNGAIFALWGYYDVGVGLGEADALARFHELCSDLAALIQRYDLGYWSRYDLYPHRLANVASPAYHLLHINQLDALARLHPDPRLVEVADRFRAYRGSPWKKRRAIGTKIAFRLLKPRNPRLARLFG